MNYIIFFILLVFIILLNCNGKFIGGNINKLNKNIDPYFINLDKSKDRLKEFKKKMNKENLNIKRFKAINGENIDENIIKQVQKNCKKYYKLGLRKWKGCLSKGQLGCYLSHINLWKKLKSNKNLLVLEDDIIFTNNFIEKFNKILLELPQNWDMLLIGWWRQPFKFKKKYSENQDISKNLQKTNYPYLGTHGYLINKSFIKKMKKNMNINNIYIPIDNFLSDNIPNLNIYNTKKPLVNQDLENLKSNIGTGVHLKQNTNFTKQQLL